MASLDFELEKSDFRSFYENNHHVLSAAQSTFTSLLNAFVGHSEAFAISKIEGRIKEKEECIRKFNSKYRPDLEVEKKNYEIKDHITDLIGIRIVCLYEDDIEKIKQIILLNFHLISKTDKTEILEKTESSFGYKGLHLDLKLSDSRKSLPEHAAYSEYSFELQIRTIIQDSWSVLDHKIKYKKSIPPNLKRRINILAALFELADREFREIRDTTVREIDKPFSVEELKISSVENKSDEQLDSADFQVVLDAFSFLKIAHHFFLDFYFESYKVDGFTSEIINFDKSITPAKFNMYMGNTITIVKKYKIHFEKNNLNDKLNPYTLIRHCLYLSDTKLFSNILTSIARENFNDWLKTQPNKPTKRA